MPAITYIIAMLLLMFIITHAAIHYYCHTHYFHTLHVIFIIYVTILHILSLDIIAIGFTHCRATFIATHATQPHTRHT